MHLTQDSVRSLLNYDQRTGIFRWKERTAIRLQVGDVAGCINPDGHVQIKINYKTYKAHHLAWLLITGEWPKQQIDHKNRNGSDNRWDNLRGADHQKNGRNRRIGRNNRSGITGVYEAYGRWRALIYVDGKPKHLGTFKTKKEAAVARRIAAADLFGDFRGEGQ